LRLILVGFGTVGRSVARIIHQDGERLVRDYGFEPKITTIVDSQGYCSDENGIDLPRALKVKEEEGTVAKYPGKGKSKTDRLAVISRSDGEIVIETTPSNFKNGEPGLSNVKQALNSGKHVVTANKGPLAMAMPALLELAAHRKLRLSFSGTVGGGTPFLSFATKCMPGERITGFHGILNGTTNYILTRMDEAGLTFKDSLNEAQEKGFAETDPTNDVEGFDTAAKVVIIANYIFNQRLSLHDIRRIGISKVTSDSLRKARKSNSRIKLVGRLSGTTATVGPEEIKLADPICVPGTLNALSFSTEHIGDVTLVGPGAGGEQTASAIIRDLVDIRREFAV